MTPSPRSRASAPLRRARHPLPRGERVLRRAAWAFTLSMPVDVTMSPRFRAHVGDAACDEHPAHPRPHRFGRHPQPHRHAAHDDADGGRGRLRHRRYRRLLPGAGARRRRPHHRRDGVAGKGRAPSPPRGGNLRRPLPAGTDTAGRRHSSRRREGVDPAWSRRRAYPHGHLRRDPDRTVGDPTSGLRDHVRNHRSGGNDEGAHRRHDRRSCRRRRAGPRRRLRLRRSPRRPRLPDLAISRAVREPAQRRLRRQPGESRALRARGAARGQGRGAGNAGHLSTLGRGFLSRRIARSTRGARSRSGRQMPGRTRCTSPPGTTARCRRRKSCCRR